MADLIRILIVDDHMVVRQGLSSLLIPRNGMEIVGEAADGEEGVRRALELQPDVILMDLIMPKKDGITAIKEIKAEMPEARILVLTSFDADNKVQSAIRAGALGYLLKDTSADELFNTIRAIAMGKLTIPQKIAAKLLQSPPEQGLDESFESRLTKREMDVLRGIARGLSNQDIASELCLSTTTVRSHVSSLLHKLKLNNRTQAALYATEMGILNHNDPN